MSINFSLKLKGNKVNEELLINEIKRLGVSKDINKIDDKGILRIDSTYELLGFTITLIKDEKPPYNIYETSFVENDFEYNQSILFGFSKEVDFDISYTKALELIFSLMREVNTSALLTSSVYDEICYFENSTNVYIKRTTTLAEKINSITDACSNWKCFCN